jgi:hypothetical protein
MSQLPYESIRVIVRGLKRHFGKFPAVDGVDLNVISGGIYGFRGINGAGKTPSKEGGRAEWHLVRPKCLNSH